jgi:hypothetical protein
VSGVSYEKEDADTRAVIRAGIALGLATLVASALVLFLFRWLAEREARGDAPPPPMAAALDPGRVPPAPRLQTLPVQDLDAFRAEEERTLTTYGWVDEQAGTVRIPIAEAMRLLVERGEAPLPKVAPTASPPPAATPAAPGQRPQP